MFVFKKKQKSIVSHFQHRQWSWERYKEVRLGDDFFRAQTVGHESCQVMTKSERAPGFDILQPTFLTRM